MKEKQEEGRKGRREGGKEGGSIGVEKASYLTCPLTYACWLLPFTLTRGGGGGGGGGGDGDGGVSLLPQPRMEN